MRKSAATSIFTARRISSAVVLPGMFAGMLVLAAPAAAATTSSPAGTTGICNGVVNQLAHRGTVQPNLLKAAAKQNAAVIQQLQLKRD
ncbi:MAG: chromosome segregation ATPase, partial [Actinomycetota bacterium]|nr:chromosome segregation ATPase [Actinomycetota bacterium]